MAAISANAFPFSGMNPRLPSEFLELFKDQQQNLNTLNPLLFNNEIARLFLQQKLAQMAAASQGNRSDASNNNNISTPTLVEAAAAVVAAGNNKRMKSESHRYHTAEGGDEEKPRKRSRIGGQSVKTAEVWRFFEQIPNEQAASCMICSKTIKATNSSTTGMIRHLRSCHHEQHEILQKARQQNSIRKVLKSGVIDGDHLNEIVLLQQLENQEKEAAAAAAAAENDRISETVESIVASTSSNASEVDVQIKGLHTIERLISTPKQDILEHDETFGSTPVSKPIKRGRPPKITLEDSMTNDSGFGQNKLNNELSILFTFKVLNVEIMDNQLFQNFLRQLAPGYPLPSADEFRKKILPSYSEAFLKNNNFLKTPIRSSKASRVTSEGKAASPAPTNESGFHDEEESHPADQSSVADSLFSFLCASVNGTPTSQHNTENKSESYHGFCETDSVISDKSSESTDQFENMFDELLDHIGHGIFPKENLHMLVIRLYNTYATVKSSKTLVDEIFKLLDVPSESNLDEVVRSREANDSGLDMNASGDKMFPRLWNCIVFAVNCFNEINTLIEKDLLTVQRFNDADYELLTALHHNIINPEN